MVPLKKLVRGVALMYPKLISDALYGRFYEIGEGIFVPSSTTVTQFGAPMSFTLLKYIMKEADGDYEKYLKSSSDALVVGTDVHTAWEHLIEGKKVTIDPPNAEIQRALTCLCMFYEQYQPKIVAMETMLYHKDYGYAGRADTVAYIGDDLWMLDVKTSKVLDPFKFSLQLTMYANLWNANNKEQITRLGVIHGKKNYRGSIPAKSTKLLHEYPFDQEGVKSALYMFNRSYEAFDRKGILKRKPKLNNEFKLKGVK